MKAKTILLIFVIIFLTVIVLGYIAERAIGENGEKFSHEEAKLVMRLCWEDARQIETQAFPGDGKALAVAHMAVALFQYRTKDN